jgi:hypothetical protein
MGQLIFGKEPEETARFGLGMTTVIDSSTIDACSRTRSGVDIWGNSR